MSLQIDDAALARLSELAPQAREHGSGLLRARWEQLDSTEPMINLDLAVQPQTRSSARRGCANIASHQIAFVDNGSDMRWGKVNNRAATFDEAMSLLGQCTTDAELADYADWFRTAQLEALPGPHGPLVRTCGDGRHRTSVLKALDLSPVPIDHVTETAVVRNGERAHLAIFAPRAIRPIRTGSRMSPDQARAVAAATERYSLIMAQHRKHSASWRAHLCALQDAGWIADLEISSQIHDAYQWEAHFLIARDLPAPWALELPERVEALSLRYAHSYPEFTQTAARVAMTDRAKWAEHAQLPASYDQTPDLPADIAHHATEPPSRRRWWPLYRRHRP